MKRYATPAEKVGQKIIVNKRIREYSGFERVPYAAGDVLTVKGFSTSRLEFSTGSHINSVEEHEEPKSRAYAFILPTCYHVIKTCYDCDPRQSDRDGTNLIPEVKDQYYCESCKSVWVESGVEDFKAKALDKEVFQTT